MEKSYLDFYPDIIINGLKPLSYDVSHIDVCHRQEKVIVNAIYECKHCGLKFVGLFTFFHLKPKIKLLGTQFSGLGCFARTISITYLSKEL
ncbi:MAG: hypothetical protein IPO78_10195 [Saprospiraceae bacterium]|nr:hypothetical protein [Saprospiraceae bacterium]